MSDRDDLSARRSLIEAVERFTTGLGGHAVAQSADHLLLVTGDTFAEIVALPESVMLTVWLEREVQGPPFWRVRPLRGRFVHIARLESLEVLEQLKPFLIEAHAASMNRPPAPLLDDVDDESATRMRVVFVLEAGREVGFEGDLLLEDARQQTTFETPEGVYTFTHRFGRPAAIAIRSKHGEVAITMGVSRSVDWERVALGDWGRLLYKRRPMR